MRNSGNHPSSRRNIAFTSSVEGAPSFKDFFLTVDALVALEWKVEFTFLKQLFCCGAETTCALPRWTGEFSGSATEETFERTRIGIEFAHRYFHTISTRDDLFLMKKTFPLIWEWYQANAHMMFLGSLDNNRLLTHAPLIKGLPFLGVDTIKLGPEFLSNEKAARAAFDAIREIGDQMPIYRITMAETPDTTIQREIIAWAEKNGVENELVTAEKLIEERHSDDGTAPNSTFELYEDHSIFFVQDRFYLHKYDHLGCGDGSFYTVNGPVNSREFIYNLVTRRIDYYRENTEKASGRVKDYFTWVVENVEVDDNYTFIPGFMMQMNGSFANALVEDNLFALTSCGLLNGNPVPLVKFK